MAETSSESPTWRPIKRIVSFDFLRGCAIMGVIGFHVLGYTYNYEAVLDAEPPIVYYFLIAILAFVGQMFPMFLIVSAISNIFSLEKRIQKRVAADLSKEEKKKIFRKLYGDQILRGGLLIFFGYLAECVLDLVGSIFVASYQAELLEAMYKNLFTNQIIAIVGFCVLFSSVIYLGLRKRGLTLKKIQTIFLILMVLVVVLTPVVNILFHVFPGYWDGEFLSFDGRFKPMDDWDTQGPWITLLYFILSPYVYSYFPLFPNSAAFLFGVVIGMKLVNGKVTKKTLRFLFIWSAIFLIWGLIWRVFTTDMVLDERLFPPYDVNDLLVPMGASCTALVLILYYAEARGYGNGFAKKTLMFRRFGTMTLTLWYLQLLVFPIFAGLQQILNAIRGTNFTLEEGPIWNGGMSGYATTAIVFGLLVMYGLILWLWEKANFAFSLEWLITRIIGGKKSGSDKTDIKYMLYHVESIISPEEGDPFYRWYNFLFLYVWLLINILIAVVLLFL